MVVDKPSGLLSVPAKDPTITDHVRARIAALYPRASGPLTVHRLDMETSGVMVLALDPEAHRHLCRQFQDREVEKTYEAVLVGEVDRESGCIDLPIRLDPDRRPLQVVDPALGRPATTAWRVIDRAPGRTRIEFFPRTGRTHQLRVHAAEGLGCPIAGDRLYGDPSTAPRLLLHARRLRFVDPTSDEPRSVESRAPF